MPCVWKNREEGVALSADDRSTALGDRRTQNGDVPVLDVVVPLAQLLKQLGGPLHVCEEESDGAGWEACHKPPSPIVLFDTGC